MPPQHSHDDYVKSVEMMRREKDYFFKEDRESPIPHALRAKFDGLAYYLPDPKYRVRAKLVKDPNPQKVVLATSKGVPRDMIRYGVFEFEIDGTKQRLAAYKSLPQPGHRHEDESLFVPFRDSTSGKETYGAARYLDIEEPPTDEYVIDVQPVLRVQRGLRVSLPAAGELALDPDPGRREELPAEAVRSRRGPRGPARRATRAGGRGSPRSPRAP